MKNPLSTKRTVSLLLCAVVAVCAAVLLWQNRKIRRYEQRLSNAYAYSLGEVEHYVGEMENLLLLGAVTQDPYEIARMSTSLYDYARAAVSAMGQLPIFNTELDSTARFLTQAGEFGHALSLRHLENGMTADDERHQLAQLASYAGTLRGHLNEMSRDLRIGTLSFERFTGGSAANYTAALESIEQDFSEYPEILYEGPHSSDVINTVYTGSVAEEPVITQEEAAQRMLACRDGELDGIGYANAALPVFTGLIVNGETSVSLSFTEHGGHLAALLVNRPLLDATASEEDALLTANAFLQENGYSDCTLLTKEDGGSAFLFRYAAVQDNVLLYPDLIRIRVAADTAEVIGFDATSYLLNHRARNLPPIGYSMETAMQTRQNLPVLSARTVVIPNMAGREVLCHELIGSLEGQPFYLYINCENGREEDLFLRSPSFL